MASASSDVGHLSKWRNVLLIMGIGGSKRQKHWRCRDSDYFSCEVLIISRLFCVGLNLLCSSTLLPRRGIEKRCRLVTGMLLLVVDYFIMLLCLCPVSPISYHSQSGLVFGILKLSGFVTATIYSLVGHKFNSRTMAFLGSSTQGISVLVFGMIEYTEDKVVFLTLSYTLRYEFSLEINDGKLSA